MPAVRRLPDARSLERLLKQGWTMVQIAEEFDVSRGAVGKALQRAGLTAKPMRVTDLIPWKVDPAHQALTIMEHFRAIVKQQRQLPLRPSEEAALNNWLKILHDNDVVVNYHPDAPPNDASQKGGFYYVPRVDADDWIIRRP